MSRKEALRFPLPIPSRLALIDADFRLASYMRAFESSDVRGLVRYAPDAMALPLNAALSLADGKLRGLFELPSLRLAIVVFSSAGLQGALEMGALETHHRDLLWKAFGLPVFEQLRGADGRVIARECEVHNGLHVDAKPPEGMAVEIVTEQCDCGLETARLRWRMAVRARAAAA